MSVLLSFFILSYSTTEIDYRKWYGNKEGSVLGKKMFDFEEVLYSDDVGLSIEYITGIIKFHMGDVVGVNIITDYDDVMISVKLDEVGADHISNIIANFLNNITFKSYIIGYPPEDDVYNDFFHSFSLDFGSKIASLIRSKGCVKQMEVLSGDVNSMKRNVFDIILRDEKDDADYES